MYCSGRPADIPDQENRNAVNDQRLLREYADNRSQSAFHELTERYIGLVYSTCRRETGSKELAEDATQAVFILLAQKARSLSSRDTIGGWLFQTALLTARNARRTEVRRLAREAKIAREYEDMTRHQTRGDDETDRLLNEAVASLKPADREAVLLRYMSGCTLGETGAALGIAEDGARKRIERGLSKLQRFLTGHGVVLGAGGVVLLLDKHAEEASSHLVVVFL